MELFHELFLTVAITVIFSFVLSKIFLLLAGGSVKDDALLGSYTDGDGQGKSERGGRFLGEGSKLTRRERESVLGKLEVREVIDDVDEDVGLGVGERLVEGGCGEETVEVVGIEADLVEECVEDGGSSEKRKGVEDNVAMGLDERLMEGVGGEKTEEVGEIAVDLVEECVEDEGSSEKREAIEDDVEVGLDKRLMEKGCGEKTVEVCEIAADSVEECGEDEGSSEKREGVEDDVAIGLGKQLVEKGRGEKQVEACDGVGGIEAGLIEGYAEDEGSSEKETVEEDTVVGLEARLTKGDRGEETVEAVAGVRSEVEADLFGDEGCSGEIEKIVESEETLMKGDIGEETVKVGDGVDEVEPISVHECVDHKGNSEKREAVDCLDCEVKDEVGDEREDLFDDDWEGIQRTDLDRAFGAAAAFVNSEKNADHFLNLSSDEKMQLYGLHKVATEGPCQEPPPMALKISARAKWNAWQRLGNMSPEAAMEQYVTLLSRDIPGWLVDDPHMQEQQGS